jgi:hypothetical protein
MDAVDARGALERATNGGAALIERKVATGTGVVEISIDTALSSAFWSIVPAEQLPLVRQLVQAKSAGASISPDNFPVLSVLLPRFEGDASRVRLQYYARRWTGDVWADQPEGFIGYCDSYYRWIKRWAKPLEGGWYTGPHTRTSLVH